MCVDFSIISLYKKQSERQRFYENFEHQIICNPETNIQLLEKKRVSSA